MEWSYAGLELRSDSIANAVEFALLAKRVYELINGRALRLLKGKLRGLWFLVWALNLITFRPTFEAYVCHSSRLVWSREKGGL